MLFLTQMSYLTRKILIGSYFTSFGAFGFNLPDQKNFQMWYNSDYFGHFYRHNNMPFTLFLDRLGYGLANMIWYLTPINHPIMLYHVINRTEKRYRNIKITIDDYFDKFVDQRCS